MNKKLKEIEIENFLIVIYYILITLYLYANMIEKRYIIYQNETDKEKYRILLYIVFGVAFIIALYFVIENINDLNNTNNLKTRNLEELSAIANILVLTSAIIALYIVYKDKDIELEVTL